MWLQIIAYWSPPNILRIALQIMLTMAVICIASCERPFSKLKQVLSYLRASLTSNKSGKVVWSSFDEKRKGGVNNESLLWWNNKRLYFDKGMESVVLLSVFASFNRKRQDIFMFHWNCIFRTQVMHDLHWIIYYKNNTLLAFFVRYTIS